MFLLQLKIQMNGCTLSITLNDEIPSAEDFEKIIADYLTFEVNMITHGRAYLFGAEENTAQIKDDVLKVAEDGADYV